MRPYREFFEKTGNEWNRVDFPKLRVGSIFKIWNEPVKQRKVLTPPRPLNTGMGKNMHMECGCRASAK